MKNGLLIISFIAFSMVIGYLLINKSYHHKDKIIVNYPSTVIYKEKLTMIFYKSNMDDLVPVRFNSDLDTIKYSDILYILEGEIPNSVIIGDKFYGTMNYSIEEWNEFIQYNLK